MVTTPNKKPFRNWPPRVCRTCGATFLPIGSLQKSCHDCSPGQKWSMRIVKYGVGKKDWDKMFHAQGGLCALCREKKAHVIDHDHATGKVRGLLCVYCNSVLSRIERPGWLDNAKAYLESPPPDIIQIYPVRHSRKRKRNPVGGA